MSSLGSMIPHITLHRPQQDLNLVCYLEKKLRTAPSTQLTVLFSVLLSLRTRLPSPKLDSLMRAPSTRSLSSRVASVREKRRFTPPPRRLVTSTRSDPRPSLNTTQSRLQAKSRSLSRKAPTAHQLPIWLSTQIVTFVARPAIPSSNLPLTERDCPSPSKTSPKSPLLPLQSAKLPPPPRRRRSEQPVCLFEILWLELI